MKHHFLNDPTITKYKMAGVVKNSLTGRIRCTCYRGYECDDKGKHYLNNYPEKFQVIEKPSINMNYQAEFPGEYIILDVDDLNSFKYFMNDFGLRSFETPTVETSKGFHYYFKTPKPLAQQVIYHGIELKSKVNIPPSVKSNGKPYEWVLSPDDVDYEEIPSSILSIAKIKTKQQNYTLKQAPCPCEDWELELIRESLNYNPDCHYDDWFRIAVLLHSTGSIHAFDIWLDWSNGGKKYQGEKTLKSMKNIWDGIKFSPRTHYISLRDYGVNLG